MPGMTTPPTRTPIRLLAAGLALTAFLAAGCGVDGKDDAGPEVSAPVVDEGAGTTVDPTKTTDDPSETTDDTSDDTSDSPAGLPDPSASTTEPSDDDSMTTEDGGGSGGGSVPSDVQDQIVDLYVDMGFTKDQATCLTDKFMDAGGATGDVGDMSQIMDWLGECDISMSDLSNIGAGG